MLTGLKVWSFSCKYVFYRQEHNAKRDSMKLNFEGLEMQKWNIPTNRAWKADEKNRIICLAIIVISRVMVIKMSRMAIFLYFLLMTAEN